MTPDDRFRRAEGAGPWLHPPRKKDAPKWGYLPIAACFAVAALALVGVAG